MKAKPKPLSFVSFAEKVLGLHLTDAQRVLARVALDGIDPVALEPRERAIARELFGDVDRFPKTARRIFAALCGRGSGKSTLGAARSVYRALVADLSGCGPGDVPTAIVIAPDKRTAQLSIRMARELVRRAPSIEKLVVSESTEGFTLRRPDKRLVSVEAFAASRGGAAGRGRSILDFTLDESQFFRSDDGGAFVVNDADIYRALVPRLMSGGMGLLLSTPWPTPTLHGELFKQNFGNPMTAIAAKARTEIMRAGDTAIAEVVALERARDPDNALREFDCDTSVGGGELFFDANAIAAAMDPTPLPLPHVAHHAYAAGCDFGFRSDSSAIVIVSFDGDICRVVASLELRPKKGEPLKPSDVVAKFAALASEYGIRNVLADAHYRESIAEHLAAHDLSIIDAPAGQSGKLETFARTRSVLHEGKLRLPDDARLLAQLRDVRAKPTPGGGTTIVQPRRAGLAHGDLVSALVLAVHSLRYESVDDPVAGPKYGSRAWEDDYSERRRKRFVAKKEEEERHPWFSGCVAHDRGPGGWWKK